MSLRKSRVGVVIAASVLLVALYHLYFESNIPAPALVHDDPYRGRAWQAQDVLGPPTAYEAPVTHTRSQSPWSQLPTGVQRYPVTSTRSFSTSKATSLPSIQHDFAGDGGDSGRQDERLAAVKEAFQHSWRSYKEYAWLKDELAPVTGSYRQTFGGWAATLVDSLDTLWLMGMKDEFEQAIDAIQLINFNEPYSLPINVFETTIRYLGGLLGAYDVSGRQYPILLRKATEVADMLYGAFDTPNRMPVTRWSKLQVEVAGGETMIAELASMSLEYTRLSQLTGDMKYYDGISRITDCISSQILNTRVPGLLPQLVNARECDFSQNPTFTLGAMTDSVYEYFIKTHQLLKGTHPQYADLWKKAAEPIQEHLLFQPLNPANQNILLPGTLKAFKDNEFLDPQVQHLSCFAGGMFALASRLFDAPELLGTGIRLTEGCIWAYNVTETGIMPELFHLVPCDTRAGFCEWSEDAWADDLCRRNTNDDVPGDRQLPMSERISLKQERLRMPTGMTAIANREYRLRPEAIESVFVLYRITGDRRYRGVGWRMFEAVTNYTRTVYGFGNIEDVTATSPRKLDRMESFWMTETLKYFWLLFEDETVVSLDDWVLTTEAHPFKLDWEG